MYSKSGIVQAGYSILARHDPNAAGRVVVALSLAASGSCPPRKETSGGLQGATSLGFGFRDRARPTRVRREAVWGDRDGGGNPGTARRGVQADGER